LGRAAGKELAPLTFFDFELVRIIAGKAVAKKERQVTGEAKKVCHRRGMKRTGYLPLFFRSSVRRRLE